MLEQLAILIAVLVGLSVLPGCSLFRDNERTSIITPDMRAASIREFGPRAEDASDSERLAMCEELAKQIRTEPDPICRRAIQETIAEFDVPLASAVLVAGLSDEDRDVRTACCRMLAKRQDESAIAPLSRMIAADADAEVRMAAIDALGKFKSPAAVQGLAAAVKDRDPAMQYAGVEAMKTSSGEDLGNDVAAWRQYADTLPQLNPAPGAGEVNIATEPGGVGTVR
jgi:HEAT repeat protein